MIDPLDRLEPVLAADEIQGNVLGGFNKDHQAVIALRFEGGAASLIAVRAWLNSFVPGVTWLREVVEYKRVHGVALRTGATTHLGASGRLSLSRIRGSGNSRRTPRCLPTWSSATASRLPLPPALGTRRPSAHSATLARGSSAARAKPPTS